MTVLAAPPTLSAEALCDQEREILCRIDRGGLAICEAELRHTLRWNEASPGSLLGVLADLEASGLVESALHFRLTDRGRAELPAAYQPPVRVGSGIPWVTSPPPVPPSPAITTAHPETVRTAGTGTPQLTLDECIASAATPVPRRTRGRATRPSVRAAPQTPTVMT
jgi:hypothetical protein